MRHLRRFSRSSPRCSFFFFFNDTATTEIYTLSLHDALPISPSFNASHQTIGDGSDHINPASLRGLGPDQVLVLVRSEEHTSELQSRPHLVCRLLLEKKNRHR